MNNLQIKQGANGAWFIYELNKVLLGSHDKSLIEKIYTIIKRVSKVESCKQKNNMEAEDLLDKFAQDEGFGNWETVVLNCHHSVIRSVAIAAVTQALHQPLVMESVCSCSKGKGIDHDEDGKAYCIDCGNYLEQTVP